MMEASKSKAILSPYDGSHESSHQCRSSSKQQPGLCCNRPEEVDSPALAPTSISGPRPSGNHHDNPLLGRIFDGIPGVLRDFFKRMFHSKFKHPWIDSSGAGKQLIADERWQLQNLSQEQLQLLASGNTNCWDQATLFYVLLHSSLCLLADKVFFSNGRQLQCILEQNSNFVMSKNSEFNFKSLLGIGDMIILDLGRESFESSVSMVQKGGFYTTHTFHSSSLISQTDITAELYVCKSEWLAIFNLSKIKECAMDDGSIKAIKNAYSIIGVQQSIINEIDEEFIDLVNMKQNGTLHNQLQCRKQPVEVDGIEHIAKLKPSDFTGEIKYYNKRHHPGTRQWILDEIYMWQNGDSEDKAKVCLITGDPGMGKSVLAAKLCALEEKQGLLAGCFFFQHQKKRRNNPAKLVHTLAYQLSKSIPLYLEMIIDQVNDDDFTMMNTSELFTVLILEPLHKLAECQQRMSVIIDAVDECDFEFRNDLLKLIIREFTKLPSWLNVIITTRSDQKVLQKLKRVKPHFQLNPTDPRNIADIKMYLSDILRTKMASEEFNDGVDLLVQKSEGMFLYFHYASEAILSCSTLTLSELQSLLPDGIDDYYEANFRRIYQKLGKSKYFTLLQAVIAARSDFPQSLIGPLLKIDESETTQVVSIISDILPVQERHIHVFHKSIRDWVTDVELAEDLLVKPSLGHNDVARLCYQKFQDIKSTRCSVSELFLDPSSRYVIENMVYHFCNATDDDLEYDFRSILFDLRYMYYRLHFSQESARDLLDDYEEASTANDQLSSLIDTCFAFVRRNAEHLASMPHLVYQCSLNEPDEIASQLMVHSYSRNLLSSFPELKLCLELINKPKTVAPTLTKCTCDDNITDIQLLPNSQNVVCSDVNGSIYIWNKRSAEQVYKEKMQGYNFAFPINECSITPDGQCISYGDLARALTPEGNTITLIPNAKTSANTCCFSPCGKYILAWSYYVDGIFRLFNDIGKPFQVDFVIELWKISNAVCMKLEHHTNREVRPISACFSHDSSLVICGHKDGRTTIWESKTGMQKAVLYGDGTVIKHSSSKKVSQPPQNDPVYAVSYSPNGHYLAACYNKGILLWDAPALSLLLKLPCTSTKMEDGKCLTCSFSPDSKRLAAGFSNGYIHAWDLQATNENPYPLKIATQPSSSSDCIVKCTFDDDHNIICAIGNNLCVYSYDSLQNASTPSEASKARHPNKVSSSTFMPNTKVALTLGSSTICAWEAHTGTLLMESKFPGSSHLMTMSEKFLLIFGEPYNIHILDKDTLKFKQTICHCHLSDNDFENDDDAPAGVTHCAISKNGMIAYGTGDGLIYIYYGSNYGSTEILNAHEGCVNYIQFFPHGQAFISADDDGNVIKWEIVQGKETEIEVNEVKMEKHDDSVEQILFSQLGIHPQRIITCSIDNSLHLYDCQTCDLIKKLEGHGSGVLKIALSGDGKLIASGDSQGCLILWDSFTGNLLKHMSYKQQKMTLDLYFIKNDKYLCARGSNMNALVVYSVDKGVAVSVLSFTSLIKTTSGSSISHTSTSDAEEDDVILCGLVDGSLKFVKVCEVQEDSMDKKEPATKKKNKKFNIGYPTLKNLTLIEWQSQEGEKQLRIKQSICDKWNEVGILLEIDSSLRSSWEKQYNRDCMECCNKVLSYWLSNPCKSYPCTWDGVCHLLDNAQFGQLAADLKEVLKL